MKRVKNDQTTNTLSGALECDDCMELIKPGDKMVRIGFSAREGSMMWLLVLHPKCAKDLGGDLAIELAR